MQKKEIEEMMIKQTKHTNQVMQHVRKLQADIEFGLNETTQKRLFDLDKNLEELLENLRPEE